MGKYVTPRNPDGSINIADIRRRCQCSMHNTATGTYLADALTELEKERTRLSRAKAQITTLKSRVSTLETPKSLVVSLPKNNG